MSMPSDNNHAAGDDELREAAMVAVMEMFFQQDEWPHHRVDSDGIRTAYKGDHGQWSCFCRARATAQQYVFYSVCPVQVPENRLVAMAEFLSRANYGLIIGNFELDFNDGELRYKTSLDVEGLQLDYPPEQPWAISLFKQIVYANVLTMDRYLPGILRIIASDTTPAEVIAEIEGV